MFACRGLAALLQQVADTLTDVVHPFRLLCGRGSVDGKGLGGGLNEPAVTQVTLIRYSIYGDAL